MEPTDQELETIKNLLRNNEESYRPGAWENFSGRKKKKKKTTLWPMAAGLAAAVILIISGILLLIDDRGEDATRALRLPASPQVTQLDDTPADEVTAQKSSGTAKTGPYKAKKRHLAAVSQQSTLLEETISRSITSENLTSTAVVAPPVPPESVVVKRPSSIPGVSQPLPSESLAIKRPSSAPASKTATTDRSKPFSSFPAHQQQVASTRNPEKWDIGLLLSSDLQDSKKAKIGFAATVGYALTSRLSLTSGIGYLHIAGDRTVANPQVLESGAESQESIHIRYSGIDIPLGITYHVSRNMYANVGVSAFSVLRKNGEKSTINTIPTQRSFVNGAGDVQYETVIVEEKVVSPVNPDAYTGSNTSHIGLINLSIGLKQKIFDDKHITLAPFVKLPMKNSTKEQVNLFSAGLNIGLNF